MSLLAAGSWTKTPVVSTLVDITQTYHVTATLFIAHPPLLCQHKTLFGLPQYKIHSLATSSAKKVSILKLIGELDWIN